MMTVVERKFNGIILPYEMLKLYARILSIGVPTLSVINGHAVAGGLLLALCHDKVIMEDDPKWKLQMNEILINMSINFPYSKMCKHLMPNGVSKMMYLGTVVRARDALNLNMI
jgi:enoyl-CoA hydratase/carnithine racemase